MEDIEAPNNQCCRNKKLPDNLFNREDVGCSESALLEYNEEIEGTTQQGRDDGLVNSFFERLHTDNVVLDLESVLLTLTQPEHELSSPPDTFDSFAYLQSPILPEAEATDSRLQLTSLKNTVIQHLLEPESSEKVELFTKILWLKTFLSIEAFLVQNADEIIITKLQFTDAKAKMNQFTKCSEYFQLLMALFDVTTLSAEHTSVGFSWCNYVFHQLVHVLAEKLKVSTSVWSTCQHKALQSFAMLEDRRLEKSWTAPEIRSR